MSNVTKGGIDKETMNNIADTVKTIVSAVNAINTKETTLYEMAENWGNDNDQPGDKAQKIVQKAKEVIDERKYLAHLYDELGKMLGINPGDAEE